MKRGALVNLLIGITIALLPLYNRVTVFDFNRTAKDNLLVILLALFGFILPGPVRKLSSAMIVALIYGLSLLVINQWNVISINVIFQSFYIAIPLIFFFSYYEKYDQGSIEFIKWGMMAGAIIQSIFAICGYFQIEAYAHFAMLFSEVGNIITSGGGAVNTVGSLGNSNLLSSYLAFSTIAFFESRFKWLAILPLTALMLSQSAMGIASLAAGTLYYFNLKFNLISKAKIYLSSIFLMIAVYFTGIGGMDSGRFDGWSKLFKLVTWKHFLIGMGPGWFPDQKMLVSSDVYFAQEHNAFLSIFNVYGIIGFLTLAPIFFKFINTKDENKIFSSVLFAAFCNSYGHFTLHQSTVVIIMIVAACISLGESNGINLER